MKKVFLLIMTIFPIYCFSQNPITKPTPVRTPVPISKNTTAVQPTGRRPRDFEQFEKNVVENEILEENRQREEKVKVAREIMGELYRKPTKKELNLVAVDAQLKIKFANFLKTENTGLFKFLKSNCHTKANVVEVSEECLANTIPGAGASFSFRINNYRIPALSDLSFVANNFLTVGQWGHGLLLDIGNIPLEEISVQNQSVVNLSDFAPASDFKTARFLNLNLHKGVKHNDSVFYSHLPAKENTTYLLRSIAYRGSLPKVANGLAYNELDFDKRKDVLIAFRIVGIDEKGSVTVLWKQLAEKDSPKIQAPKINETLGKNGNQK